MRCEEVRKSDTSAKLRSLERREGEGEREERGERRERGEGNMERERESNVCVLGGEMKAWTNKQA